MLHTEDISSEYSRIFLFTGKGGVGKSSLIAAHALRSAKEGVPTLLVSADMAHNLGDIFGLETGGEPVQAAQNLTILELDPQRIMEEEYPELNRAVLEMLSSKGRAVGDIAGQFMIPGFENLFSLLKVFSLYESGRYGRIFVDCAPSGETLSLLKLPELLTWYVEKFYPAGRLITRVLAPVSERFYQVKLPDTETMDQIPRLHARLTALQDLLRDDARTAVRLVCLPEKMVVEETKRTYMFLNLYGYHVDRIFVNRLLPDTGENAFIAHWRSIQEGYLQELEQVFSGIPMTKIPWYEEEIRGLSALERMADALPGSDLLFAASRRRQAETYEAVDGGYLLRIAVPGAELKVDVLMQAQDLDIRAGNMLRRIPLPDVLRGYRIGEFKVEEGVLTVFFQR